MSNFIFQETKLHGLYIIDVKSYGDNRGYFMETYKESDFLEAGLHYSFVQDNQSSSVKGVIRGLHFQLKHPQAKLVRVISGEVFDVAVDLRDGSATYGQWSAYILSAENKKQLLIPRGFAHGFMVLSDRAEFVYKCDDYYHPEDEGGIAPDDPTLAIKWPDIGIPPILSEKDTCLPAFSENTVKFVL